MDSLSGPLSNIPVQIGIWKCWIWGVGKPGVPEEEPCSARRELTAQPIYGTDARVWIWAKN